MVPSESPKFPLIYRDFVKMFPDESSCVTYLVEQLRWSDGFVCPACQRRQEPWRQTRGRLVCPACHHQTTVTAGTIFDKTRTPLTGQVSPPGGTVKSDFFDLCSCCVIVVWNFLICRLVSIEQSSVWIFIESMFP